MTPRQHLIAAGLAVTLGFGLAGCATTSDYAPEVAERLQSQVLEATSAAASADLNTLLARLDALEVEVRDALARGQVTQARHDAITAAIAHVRSDTEAAIAAQQPVPEPEPAPAPAPAPEPVKEKPEKPGKGEKPEPPGKGPKKDKPGKGNNGNG